MKEVWQFRLTSFADEKEKIKMDIRAIDINSILMDNEASVYDKLFAGFIQNRILVLNQDVDMRMIDDAISWIIQWNLEDMCIAKKDRKPITLFIHSYGGDMYVAGPMIDIIRSSETPIKVIGLGLVASAAYLIYLAADERYAFHNTIFLQHDGEIDLSNSTGKAKDTMAFFDGMNERVKNYVLERTTMDEAIYDKNVNREFYMYSNTAKDFGIVHKIIGKDISLKQIFKV